jgi:CDGSH-type Zn-finger protein
VSDVKVLIIENGPLKVIGGVACVNDATGEPVPGGDEGTIFLCRCGGSQNKPYCDGSHKRNGFDGTFAVAKPAEGAAS